MGEIEVGVGNVWSMEAGENLTSGLVVTISGDGTLAKCHYGQRAIGVILTPASAGDEAAVLFEGVAKVLVTGTAAQAGLPVVVSNGAAFGGNIYVTASGTDDVLAEDLRLGIALEDISAGSKGKIRINL